MLETAFFVNRSLSSNRYYVPTNITERLPDRPKTTSKLQQYLRLDKVSSVQKKNESVSYFFQTSRK